MNVFKNKLTVLCLGALLMIGSSCKKSGSDPVPDNVTYTIGLSGGQETPATKSSASGTSTITYDKTSKILSYTINYTGLTPSAMHFHTGVAGESGPISITIPGPYSSGMTGKTVALTSAQETSLLGGSFYLNIHSTTYPNGEIRGQVVGSDVVVFNTVTLSGAKEAPATNSSAMGTVGGSYNKTTKMLSYAITFSGTTPSAMHFHTGSVGVSGPISITIAAPYTSGMKATTAALTAQQETDLLAGNFYLNIHSTAYASGEIRGQMVTNEWVTFDNITLNGINEAPTPVVTTAVGTMYGAYNKTTKMLSYVITYANITPTAMHFHKGAVGVAGPVVVTIPGPYTSGMTAKTAALTAEQDLLSGNWYVNVHSEMYTGGEIRGQVLAN